MVWFWLTLVTAVTQAVKDMFLKRALDSMPAGLGMLAYCVCAAVVLWFGVAMSPHTDLAPSYWFFLCLGGVLGGLTYWLYGRALQCGDLSLTMPMLAFTPLFLLVTSPLTLGEFPEPGGLAGIASTVVGAYVLNLRERRHGFLGPIKALLRNKGSRLMLLVAAIWSIGANCDKLGLQASSPAFWGASIYTATALALAPTVGRGWRLNMRSFGWRSWPLVLAGTLEALGLFCQMHALPLTQVSYVISVKRLSIIFAVLLGAMVLKEPDLRHRLPGAALMVIGVFFIAVFG